MTLTSLLKNYTAYNLWANTRLVEWLQSKPADLWQQEVPSSFPSLHATLLHIWSAEKVWLDRLRQVPSPVFLFQHFTGTTADVFEGLVANSRDFATYIQAQDETFFQETCHFRFLSGQEDGRVRADMIQHCIQHSTFHRGQVVTIARNLGLTDPPATDYIVYVRLEAEKTTA